jgi:hypothetical protein
VIREELLPEMALYCLLRSELRYGYVLPYNIAGNANCLYCDVLITLRGTSVR